MKTQTLQRIPKRVKKEERLNLAVSTEEIEAIRRAARYDDRTINNFLIHAGLKLAREMGLYENKAE